METTHQEERPGTPFRDVAPEPAPEAADARRNAPGRLELVREFINTADREHGTDELGDLRALRAWLRKRDLIGARERLQETDVARARNIREALRSVLEARDYGNGADAAAIRSLNAASGGATLRVSFDSSGVPRLGPAAAGLDRALAELYAIVERATLDGTWERLKLCADDGCLWAFYDHSKNRSRSWCSMEVCGNRHKAREYRRRRRSPDAPERGSPE